jgi:hypothetical protein
LRFPETLEGRVSIRKTDILHDKMHLATSIFLLRMINEFMDISKHLHRAGLIPLAWLGAGLKTAAYSVKSIH